VNRPLSQGGDTGSNPVGTASTKSLIRRYFGRNVTLLQLGCGAIGGQKTCSQESEQGLLSSPGRTSSQKRVPAGPGAELRQHRRRKDRHRPAPAVHEDLVKRKFVAEAPDQLWCTDVTEPAEGRQGLLLCRPRRLQPSHRRLVRARRRRPPDGHLAPPAGPRGHRPQRQGQRLNELDLRPPTAGSGSARRHHGPSGLVGRQHDDGVILVDHAARAPRPTDLAEPGPARLGNLRVDRVDLQPRPPAHLYRRSQPSGVRSTSHRRASRGMITSANLPGRAGQAPGTTTISLKQ
jgi:hypothetical protein